MNSELSEFSIEELEAQRAVLLPPREELGGRRRRRNRQEGLINVNLRDVNILSDNR